MADDNAGWQKIIAGILREHELVGIVDRGDRVIEAAQQFCPEVITLDVSMPGESGLNVLPRLRAAFPKTIIIIVSATATRLYREEAFNRGADGYVEKSRALSDLINTIASAPQLAAR